MWSKAGQLDWCVENGRNGGVAYAVQAVVNGGSELLIFVPRAAHSYDLTLSRSEALASQGLGVPRASRRPRRTRGAGQGLRVNGLGQR
jgi:hypothetical protein